MAKPKEEIINWLESLPAGAYVGVDDGGLCLRMVDDPQDDYCEIGGMPEEDEDEE